MKSDLNGEPIYVDKRTVADFAAARVSAVKTFRDLIDKKFVGIPADQQGPGKIQILQYVVFADQRTGVSEEAPLLVKSSGFSLDYELKANYVLGLSRTGKDNNGATQGEISTTDNNQQEVPLK